jgi:hypothetical protein
MRRSQSSIQAPQAGAERRRDSDAKRINQPDTQGVSFFIPSKGIDISVLAYYLKLNVDRKATIRRTTHPQNPSIPGYLVFARRKLDSDELRHVIEDTRAWEREQGRASIDAEPYGYEESDTANDRRAAGKRPI